MTDIHELMRQNTLTTSIPEYLRTMACVHFETGRRVMPRYIDDEVFRTAADEIERLESALWRRGTALLAERERTTALKAEMDKLWSMFVVQCESIEDRETIPVAAEYAEHAKGFYAGSKFAAKSIRRSVVHPQYNKADFPAYNGEVA